MTLTLAVMGWVLFFLLAVLDILAIVFIIIKKQSGNVIAIVKDVLCASLENLMVCYASMYMLVDGYITYLVNAQFSLSGTKITDNRFGKILISSCIN